MKWVRKWNVFLSILFQPFTMINIAGVISVILFYILILAVGMWASRKQSGVEGVDQEVIHAAIYSACSIYSKIISICCIRLYTKFYRLNILCAIGRGDAGWKKHWDVCWDIYNDCYVGWWWLHQWDSWDCLLKWTYLVSSPSRIRFKLDAW